MPKYLAQNFLAEALQHRRSLLERMLITPPHHIEFVDVYVHRGEVEDTLCTSPWLLEEFDADPLTHPSGSLQDDVVVDEEVKRDLSRLLGEGGSLRDGVESYQEGSSLAPSESDAGSDIDLLSQDIDSAIEKFASSSVAGGAMGGLGCMMEEFPAENIHPWDINIEPECGQHLLEEPESPSHLALLSARVPLAKDLAQRVKLMLIQDPLVDSAGQPYTCMSMFKSDFLLDSDISSLQCKERCSDILAPPFEEFDHEAATTDDSELDPVLELFISSPSSPLASEAVGVLPLLPPPIISPDKEMVGGEKQSNEELKSLVQDMNLSAVPAMEHLDFSPSARQKTGVVDFTKLNNADVSHDSDDSGIGHALLESPCLPSTSSPITTTSITKQLSTLDPFPLSPSDKLVLMSPSSEQKFLKRLWDKDKVFDSILALVLPYLDIGETIETLVMGSNVLLEATLLLNLTPLKLDGDLELELPWDPLAESYREMLLAQRRLTWPWFAGEERGQGDGAKGWREEFSAEDSLSTAVEDDALPIGIPQGGGGGAHPSGKPGCYPSSHPLNQLQTRRTHSSLPASRTLDQLSSRPAALSNLPGGSKTNYFPTKNGSTMAGGRGDQSTATSLDTFMALRSSRLGVKRGSDRVGKDSAGPERKKGCPLSAGPRDTPEEEGNLREARVTSPVFSDVCLSGEYLSAVSKIEGFATPMITALLPFGLNVPRTVARFGGLSLDAMKFFLKQQQKALDDNRGQERAVELLQSCRLAACLYVLGSLAETLMHCSLTAGLGRFSSLYGKYENLIGGGLDVVKQELFQLQMASREGSLAHPKLHQLVKIVSRWMREERRNRSEKAIVIVDREFPTLSGELLDFLQSLPDLKSCVFSFTTDNSTNPLYLEAVEERFHHYDCLVVPRHSIADNFPWEKVSLLVEYEPLRTLLFPEGSFPEAARLKQYVTLRTVRDPSASNLADSGLHGAGLSSVQYTFIASENVTTNTQLLQLLEARYNVLIIERDYCLLRKEHQKSRGVCYADLILDQSSGVVLRPLSLLGSDVGLKTLVSLTTALSLQYEKCWIVLYAQDEKSYPFGGCVPTNIALLHASLAHYCPRQDRYEVKVLCAPSCGEAAQMIRRISEETHKNCKVWSYKDWIDRSWLAEDMNKAEKFLLNFPCLNAFSAQLMLRRGSLGQLLSMDLPQLQAAFPWLPEKALKLFCTMCHVRFNHGVTFADDASEWSSAGGEGGTVGFRNMQETEYDYAPTTTSNDSAPQQLEACPGQDAVLQYGFTMSGDSYTDGLQLSRITEPDVIVLSSEDKWDANVVTHTELNHSYTHGQFGGAFASEPPFSGTNELPAADAQDNSFCHSSYSQTSYSNSYNQAPYMSPQSQFPTDPSVRPTSPMFLMFGAGDGEFNPGTAASSFHPSPACDRTQTTQSMLDLPQPISPPPYTSLCSRNQPVAVSSINSHRQPPGMAKRPVFSSGRRVGKTPSQKQIQNVVMSKFSGGSQPPKDNTSRLAKEYYSGPVSSSFLASAAVRHTSTPLRNPIKSLDLGFDSLTDEVERPQFQSNDRPIAATCSTNGRSSCNVASSRDRNVSALEDVRVSGRLSGLLDLKAFHSRERQQVIQEGRWNPTGTGNTSTSTHTSKSVDNWLGVPCLISKATRHKRPYSDGFHSDGFHSDYQVPSDAMSPEGAEPSLYGSPGIGLMMLSPTRPKKRRLGLEKLPGSANGQTRITFS